MTDLLRSVRRGEFTLPEGMNITTFLFFGGVIPADSHRPGEDI
jgi:hypothetical protein